MLWIYAKEVIQENSTPFLNMIIHESLKNPHKLCQKEKESHTKNNKWIVQNLTLRKNILEVEAYYVCVNFFDTSQISMPYSK